MLFRRRFLDAVEAVHHEKAHGCGIRESLAAAVRKRFAVEPFELRRAGGRVRI